MVTSINPHFWQGKKVLLTGHTGFKGGWLAIWLQRMGAQVTGISLPPITTPNLFDLAQVDKGMVSHFCDIQNYKKFSSLVSQAQPEIIFHLAAQPLVLASYADPLNTFSTNFMGTVNLLNAMRKLETLKAAVFVTTDKVYENKEWFYPYRENDALGGHDPYSASKAASELAIASYRDAFLSNQGVAVASARAGNVIGGGDWSANRLIPDAVRAWQTGQTLTIRHPDAVRPWQHVLDPLAGYLILAEQLWNSPNLAGAFNFGPQSLEVATVRTLIELANASFGQGNVQFGDGIDVPHEAGLLALDIAKAHKLLRVKPLWSLSQAVHHSIGWYKAQELGADARNLCLKDISSYEASV